MDDFLTTTAHFVFTTNYKRDDSNVATLRALRGKAIKV